MNRLTLGNNWREAKRKLANMWSTNPTVADEEDTQSVHVIAEKLQVQNLFAPASPIERVVARIVAPKLTAKRKEESKQQGEALGTWEDEGGATAASAPKNRTDNSKQ